MIEACKRCFVVQVLTLANKWDFYGELFWSISEDDDTLVLFRANCNDLFYWGCADAEEIMPNDIDSLNQAFVDCGGVWGVWLWCARKRQQRPQGAAYAFFDEALWPLFDACGPVRETGLGNPFEPGEYKPGQSQGS